MPAATNRDNEFVVLIQLIASCGHLIIMGGYNPADDRHLSYCYYIGRGRYLSRVAVLVATAIIQNQEDEGHFSSKEQEGGKQGKAQVTRQYIFRVSVLPEEGSFVSAGVHHSYRQLPSLS